MKRLIAGLTAVLLLAPAYAEAPAEPPVESNTVGTIIFAVLFFGFCIVFAWMVWRNKDKKEDSKPQE